MSVVRKAMGATARAPQHAVSFVKNPGGYTKRERTNGAVLIFLLLLGVAALRKQSWPTWHEAGVYAAATAVVALAATVAPDFLTTLMIVVLIAVVLGNAGLISDYTKRGVDALNGALAA